MQTERGPLPYAKHAKTTPRLAALQHAPCRRRSPPHRPNLPASGRSMLGPPPVHGPTTTSLFGGPSPAPNPRKKESTLDGHAIQPIQPTLNCRSWDEMNDSMVSRLPTARTAAGGSRKRRPGCACLYRASSSSHSAPGGRGAGIVGTGRRAPAKAGAWSGMQRAPACRAFSLGSPRRLAWSADLVDQGVQVACLVQGLPLLQPFHRDPLPPRRLDQRVRDVLVGFLVGEQDAHHAPPRHLVDPFNQAGGVPDRGKRPTPTGQCTARITCFEQ